MSILLSLLLLSAFPARLASCHFHCSGFASSSASTMGPFTKLGFCCTWLLPRGGQTRGCFSRLKSEKQHHHVQGACNFFGSVLPQQKFEAMDNGPVLQPCVTAQFHLESKGKYILRHEGGLTQKTRREEKPLALSWLLFLCVFSPPPEPALVNWASQEGCLFYPRSSLWSLDLPLFYVCGLFPSLSFNHHHFTLFFSYSNYQTNGFSRKSLTCEQYPEEAVSASFWPSLGMSLVSQVALVENPSANAGDLGEVGSYLGQQHPRGRKWQALPSCLESPHRGAWQATVHRVAKSRT